MNNREDQRLKVEPELAASTDMGIEREVFGVPMIIANNEMFWGKDRMDFIDDVLSKVPADNVSP